MADILAKNGFKTKILHLGIERMLHKDKSLEDIIREFPSRIYGISLQWHFQSYDSIELSRIIKNIYPDSFVVMGGIQASIFKEEILTEFNSIDAIIDGEGEIPLLKLCQAIIRQEGSAESVPNIYYKTNNQIKSSEYIHINSASDLSKYNYAKIELLHNYREYSNIMFFQKYDNPFIHRILKSMKFWLSPLVYITAGKGCPYNCSFCAGFHNFKYFLRYKKPAIREVDSVLSEIEHFRSLGINQLTSTFYYDKREDFFKKLFSSVAYNFKDVSINADWMGLPSKEIVDVFSEMNRRSKIILLAWSLSEILREKNFGRCLYSNNELLNFIQYTQNKKVNTKIIVLSGLPFENNYTIQEEKRFIKEISSRFKNILTFVQPNELVPGTDIFYYPERFNVIKKVSTFTDYYNLNRLPYYSLGYEFTDKSEKEILREKCKDRCLIHPIYGRTVCKFMHNLNRLTQRK